MLLAAVVSVLAVVLVAEGARSAATPVPQRQSDVGSLPLEAKRLQQLSRASFAPFHAHTKNLAIVRVPGTPGSQVARNYILGVLNRTASFTVEQDEFVAATPKGQRRMSSVVATWNPYNRSRIVLAAHYDSKWFPEPNQFVAASDSAVACAMLLDLATTLDASLALGSAAPYGLQIIFFDGEEAFEEWSALDSIYGSRHLASGWGRASLDRIALFVLLDLIGTAKPRFLDWFAATSRQFKDLGFMLRSLKKQQLLHDNSPTSTFFATNPGYSTIADDHLPFLEQGVPVLHLIAFPFPPTWHTVGDNLQSLDAPTNEDILALLRCYCASVLNLTRTPPGSASEL